MGRVVLIAGPGRVRDRLVRALEEAGFEVSTATSGDAGLTGDGSADAAAAVVALDEAEPGPGLLEAGRQPGVALEEPLTAREREVLGLLADGLSNRGIASRLGISEHTVKVHVSTIYAKLRASNRAEAVTRGVRRGLVAI